jgi:hypothetical protein
VFFAKSAEEYDCKGVVKCSCAKERLKSVELIERKEVNIARLLSEGSSNGRGELVLRQGRGNTRHVSMNVTITEEISTERLDFGVGWRL